MGSRSRPSPTFWMLGHVARNGLLTRLAGLCCIALASLPAVADDIDRYIAQAQRLYGLPAVVVGVIRDGRLVDQRSSGLAQVELNVAVGPEHVFEIGSISKQFTAYAILMLREEGKLDLQAPVGRYLGGLPAPWGGVTLHQLLTHTAGLPDLEEAFGYGVYRETPSDADFLTRLLALPIEFAPGSQWRYSNTNYWLLARVIETVSGSTYGDFMQQRVFDPLGMQSTRTAQPARLLPRRAAGYERIGQRLENRDATQPHTGRGLGDIASTVGDMARWDQEQLAPRLLPRASAELAWRPVTLNDGSSKPYGYGWFSDGKLPLASLSHDGQTAGFTAAYVRVPERRLAVVVLVNAYGAPTEDIALHTLGVVDPGLKLPAPQPMAETDAAGADRVRLVLATAAEADTAWRPEWFGPDYWSQLRPWLREIAENNRRFGPVRSVTRVDGTGHQGPDARSYRVVYERVQRIVTLRFDAEGRVTGRTGRDE